MWGRWCLGLGVGISVTTGVAVAVSDVPLRAVGFLLAAALLAVATGVLLGGSS